MGGLRPAVFLDRDGTLNLRPPAHEYLGSIDEFVWVPGARDALARLAHAEYVLAVVSNQRGVARGLVNPAIFRGLEVRMQRELAPYGAHFEGFRYCFHDIGDNCDCRKPRPGMLLSLGRELGLNLARSWMVGDMESDVAAGHAAGCRTARVASHDQTAADIVAPTLPGVAERIIATDGRLDQSTNRGLRRGGVDAAVGRHAE